jgi:HSP20 family molecular chaperone IbpA
MNRGERGNIEPRHGGQGLGSLFEWEPFHGFLPRNWQSMFGIEVNRREDGYDVEIPVPGFRPEDIDVTYQDGVLTVTGKTDRRTFTRSLSVPDDIDEESINANVEHGMLIVSMRQHPARQPKRINVGTGASKTVTGTTETTRLRDTIEQPGSRGNP